MPPKLIKKITDYYGLSVADFLPEQSGYRNHIYPLILTNGLPVCIIIFKSEPGMLQTIINADSVANFLQANNLPVRTRYQPKLLQLAGKGIRYAGVYHYLPGQTIAWEAYSQGHLKILGKTMSDLHACLQNFTKHNLPSIEDDYLNIVNDMEEYFSQPAVMTALKTKLQLSLDPKVLNQVRITLHNCKRLKARQPLHMDFVRGNVLFANQPTVDNLPQISGILDFEKTALGHPLFDIARTLAFLQVDCKSKTEQQVYKYFLISGYQKRGAYKSDLQDTLPAGLFLPLLQRLVNLFMLHDFYKFLRHNPYQSLPQNQHFVRTKNLGIISGIIKITKD